MSEEKFTTAVEMSIGPIRLRFDGETWTGNSPATIALAATTAGKPSMEYDPDPVLNIAQRVADELEMTIEKIETETADVEPGAIY